MDVSGNCDVGVTSGRFCRRGNGVGVSCWIYVMSRGSSDGSGVSSGLLVLVFVVGLSGGWSS